MDQWRALYLFELGLSLLSLAAVAALPLPPTERRRAFERLDFLSFALFGGGLALVAAVLGLGRTVWWPNAPWIAWSLAAAIPMLLGGLAVEHGRANPLIDTRWLGSADILRFAVVTTMARIVLGEQSYAAIGLLTTLGLNNDELGPFYLLLFAASVAGVVASAATLNPQKLAHPVMLAVGLVAVAALVDARSTSLTRADQLYVTQAVIAFAATFFLGPALLFGMTRALQGSGHIITFLALFGIVNSLGTLGGTALLGSYQVVREKAHSAALTQAIDPTDPLVVQRLQAGSATAGRVIGDPALRTAEGGALLSQAATREANVLAYDDVFRLVALLAGATFFYLLFLLIRRARRARAAARA